MDSEDRIVVGVLILVMAVVCLITHYYCDSYVKELTAQVEGLSYQIAKASGEQVVLQERVENIERMGVRVEDLSKVISRVNWLLEKENAREDARKDAEAKAKEKKKGWF